MMLTMMYRTAAAAVRYVAPSLAADWAQMLTAAAPMTTAWRAANNATTAPPVSLPVLPLRTLLYHRLTVPTTPDTSSTL